MRLILILVVMAIVGLLSVQALKNSTHQAGDAARQAGVSLPQGATPKQQVEAVGQAVDQLQKQAEDRTRSAIDAAESPAK
ncbi:hypothetical protein [Niveibacterium terrae]|uniref:hypothetical protein n=1 Tax=Niveibacterium terrae TaxID=3373598 RepID=UPI003A906CE4